MDPNNISKNQVYRNYCNFMTGLTYKNSNKKIKSFNPGPITGYWEKFWISKYVKRGPGIFFLDYHWPRGCNVRRYLLLTYARYTTFFVSLRKQIVARKTRTSMYFLLPFSFSFIVTQIFKSKESSYPKSDWLACFLTKPLVREAGVTLKKKRVKIYVS